MAPEKVAISNSTLTTMENTTFTLPVVKDGVRRIGDLWDCTTSQAVQQNIFMTTVLEDGQDFLEAVPVHDMQYTMTNVKNSSSKAETLAVSVEVKFELAGVIAVEGAASFRKEDASSFNEEEMFCQYNIQTFAVRTRPSVQDPSRSVVDEAVRDRILSGKTSATHYVSEIRLGGNTLASLRVKDQMSHDLMELSGSFGGKMPIGPINLGLKASLEFLDTDSSSNYSKDINITSAPALETSATTVKEMFELIETLPGILENTVYLENTFLSPKVYGVATSFKLSPIRQLFDVTSPPTYILLEKDILAEFEEMIFVLNDFEVEDHYRKLMWEQDPRLVFLFPKAQEEPNPWAKDVDEFQDEIRRRATYLKEEAFNILKKYKRGLVDLHAVTNVLQNYYDKFNLPAVIARSKEDATNGSKIVSALRPPDAAVSGLREIFLFSQRQVTDYWLPDEGVRLLLRTNGQPPAGAYIKLYSIASACCGDLGMRDVKVTCPNIVEDFSLGLKVGSKETNYKDETITFVLGLLEQMILAINRTNCNTSIFYSILARVSALSSLDQINMGAIDEFISGMIREGAHIQCTNTYLQTLAALTDSQSLQSEITLVIPSQYVSSCWEAVRYYKTLAATLTTAGIPFHTIVGTFDRKGQRDGPLLFVFDKNAVLKAVCLSYLDFLVLGQLLTTGQDLTMLSPDSLQLFPLSPFRVEFTSEIVNLLSPTSNLPLFDTSSNSFETVEYSKAFQEANEILYSACFAPTWEIVGTIVNFCSTAFEGRITSLLKPHGWSPDQGFTLKEATGNNRLWEAIADDLEEFKSKFGEISTIAKVLNNLENPTGEHDWVTYLQPILTGSEAERWFAEIAKSIQATLDDQELTDEGKLTQVIKLLQNLRTSEDELLNQLNSSIKFASEKMPSTLINICKYFVDKWGREEDISKDFLQEITTDLDTSFYTKALRTLELARYENNYKTLQDNLGKLKVFGDSETIIPCLESIATLKPTQQEWVWRNSKFRFWMFPIQHSKPLIAKVFELFCKNDKVPDWLPPVLLPKVQEMLVAQADDSSFDIPTEWKNTTEMIEIFRAIKTRQIVPLNFSTILLNNLIQRPELRLSLEAACALFYWNNEETLFQNPWGLEEIQEAVQLLMEQDFALDRKDNKNSALTLDVPHINEISTINPPQIEYSDPIITNEAWIPFTGGTLKRLTIQEFTEIHTQPKLPPLTTMNALELEKFAENTLPYLWKQLCRNNPHVLNPYEVANYVDYPKLEIQPQEESTSFMDRLTTFIPIPIGMMLAPSLNCFGTSVRGKMMTEDEDSFLQEFFISRSDLIILLLTVADPIVHQQLLETIASSKMFSLPMYIPDITKNQIKVRSLMHNLKQINFTPDFSKTILTERRLLVAPYKLITVIRVGHNEIGKSTILNHSLFKDGLQAFSSKFEPGYGNGLPISRNGLVELFWLSEDTTETTFYLKAVKQHYTLHDTMLLVANVHGDAFDLPEELFQSLQKHSSAFLVFWKCKWWTELQKQGKLLEELTGSVQTYHLVLDADKSIASNVNDENILYTNENVVPKVQRVFNEIIQNTAENCSSVASSDINDGMNSQSKLNASFALVKYIQENSVAKIRHCLKLQNAEDNLSAKNNLEDHVWLETMTLFGNILNLPLPQKSEEIFTIQEHLDYLSMQSSKSSFEKVLRLKADICNQHYQSKATLEDTIALLRNEVNRYHKSSLTLLNFFRERLFYFENVEIADNDATNFFAQEVSLFQNGLALEMFNLSFGENIMWTHGVEYCFNSLKKDLKIFVLSVIGLQGSFKSTILNTLFGPGFPTGLGGCTNGILMRLHYLNDDLKKKLGGSADAILLLDSEGFGREENINDLDAATKERQMVTFLLGISHLCLVFSPSVGSRNAEAWKNVLEIGLSAFCLMNETPTVPNLLLIHYSDNNCEGQMTTQMLEILTSIETLMSKEFNQIQTRTSTFQTLETLWRGVLGGTFVHKVPSKNSSQAAYFQSMTELHEKILSVVQTTQCKPQWYRKTFAFWERIKSQPLFNFDNLDLLKNNLATRANTSLAMGHLERCFLVHEDLLQTVKADLDNKYMEEEDLKQLRKVPYTCTLKDSCECSATVTTLQQIIQQLNSTAKQQSLSEELDVYIKQLRNSIIAQIDQIAATHEIIEGRPGGRLSSVLETLLAEGMEMPKLWEDFKRHVSTQVYVPPWLKQIGKEIRAEYGPTIESRVLQGELSSLVDFPAFDQRHEMEFTLGKRSPLESVTAYLGNRLGWKQHIWLKVQVSREVKTVVNTWNRDIYHVGMVRDLSSRIQIMIDGDFSTIQCPNMTLLPAFVWEVHTYALLILVQIWKQRFEGWTRDWNPVVKLEGRKDEFPGIFQVQAY